jgi:hypothetical protein
MAKMSNKKPQLPPFKPAPFMSYQSDDSDDGNEEDEIMMIELIKNLQQAKASAMEENKVTTHLLLKLILEI